MRFAVLPERLVTTGSPKSSAKSISSSCSVVYSGSVISQGISTVSPGGGGVPEPARLGLVEVHAGDGGDYLVRLGVVFRALGLMAEALVQAVHVPAPRPRPRRGCIERAVAPRGKGGADALRERRGVYPQVLRALYDADNGVLLVELDAARL